MIILYLSARSKYDFPVAVLVGALEELGLVPREGLLRGGGGQISQSVTIITYISR